jgi:hypothetical protein
VREGVFAVGAHAPTHVDVGIAHFIAGGAVANDEQNNVPGGPVDEPMGVVGAGREAGAKAGAQHFHPGVGFQFDLALQNIDELVLARVRVARGRLSPWSDSREIHAEIGEFRVISETPIPALLVLGAIGLRVTRRVALGQRQWVEPRLYRHDGPTSSRDFIRFHMRAMHCRNALAPRSGIESLRGAASG